MPPIFINWLMNLRKLGQISSLFCILRRRDEASNVNGMIYQHIWQPFSGQPEVKVEENDVISHFLAD